MDEKGELVKSYSNLSVDNKRLELGREIDELSLIMNELLTDIKPDHVDNKSNVSGISSNSVSEDDYLTCIYESIINIKENLGDYCDFTTSFYYDDVENFDDQEYSTAGFTKIGIIAVLTAIVAIGIIILGVLFM